MTATRFHSQLTGFPPQRRVTVCTSRIQNRRTSPPHPPPTRESTSARTHPRAKANRNTSINTPWLSKHRRRRQTFRARVLVRHHVLPCSPPSVRPSLLPSFPSLPPSAASELCHDEARRRLRSRASARPAARRRRGRRLGRCACACARAYVCVCASVTEAARGGNERRVWRRTGELRGSSR